MGKKNLKQRFDHIINFSEEEKIYKEYYRNKSKKYKFYSDWKSHIIEILSQIQTQKEYDDFKHHCYNKERSTKEVPQIFMAIIAIFLPIYFSLFVQERETIIGQIVFIVVLMILIIDVLCIFLRDTTASYFYQDLAKIVEENEEEFINAIEIRCNISNAQDKVTFGEPNEQNSISTETINPEDKK